MSTSYEVTDVTWSAHSLRVEIACVTLITIIIAGCVAAFGWFIFGPTVHLAQVMDLAGNRVVSVLTIIPVIVGIGLVVAGIARFAWSINRLVSIRHRNTNGTGS